MWQRSVTQFIHSSYCMNSLDREPLWARPRVVCGSTGDFFLPAASFSEGRENGVKCGAARRGQKTKKKNKNQEGDLVSAQAVLLRGLQHGRNHTLSIHEG